MRIIHGFGGTKLTCGAYTAEFPLCKGMVRFADETNSFTARNGRLIRNHLGYRPIITIQINNASDSQTTQWVNLINAINFSKANNYPINVSPRYDFTSSYGLSYLCELTSDFDVQDVGEVAAAQYIELTFTAILRVPALPVLLSNITTQNVVTGNGDNVTTGYGNLIALQ